MPIAAVNKSLAEAKARRANHSALPCSQVAPFMAHVRERESIGRLAFEALILTAIRSGGIRGALWSEPDLDAEPWTIPAARTKAGRDHVMPLSDAAVDVLVSANRFREARGNLVFPGARSGKPLSDMTLPKICRDRGVDAVPHGFRSSFRLGGRRGGVRRRDRGDGARAAGRPASITGLLSIENGKPSREAPFDIEPGYSCDAPEGAERNAATCSVDKVRVVPGSDAERINSPSGVHAAA